MPPTTPSNALRTRGYPTYTPGTPSSPATALGGQDSSFHFERLMKATLLFKPLASPACPVVLDGGPASCLFAGSIALEIRRRETERSGFAGRARRKQPREERRKANQGMRACESNTEMNGQAGREADEVQGEEETLKNNLFVVSE